MSLPHLYVKKNNIVRSGNLPIRRHVGCGLERRGSLVVGPDGFVYKCWHDIYRDDKVIGSVKQPFEWNLFSKTKAMQDVLNWNPYRSKMCKECKVLPICQGK